MRKVLTFIFILLMTNIFGLGASASAESRELIKSQFYCKNKSWIKRISDKVFHPEDYILVLDKAVEYQQLLVQRGVLEQQFKKVDVLASFGFKLEIIQQGQDYLLIDSGCQSKSDALANIHAMRFFFNIPVQLVRVTKNRQIGRSPATERSFKQLYFLQHD